MASAVCLVLALAVYHAGPALAKQPLTLDEQERGLTAAGVVKTVGVGALGWGARVQERDKKQAGLPLSGNAANVVRYPSSPVSPPFPGQQQQNQQNQQNQQLQQSQPLQQQAAPFPNAGQASPTGAAAGQQLQGQGQALGQALGQAYGAAFPTVNPTFPAANFPGQNLNNFAGYPVGGPGGPAGGAAGPSFPINALQGGFYPGSQAYAANAAAAGYPGVGQQAFSGPAAGYPTAAGQGAFPNVGQGGYPNIGYPVNAAPANAGNVAAPAYAGGGNFAVGGPFSTGQAAPYFPGAVTTHGVYPVAYGTYTSVYHPPAPTAAAGVNPAAYGPAVVHAAAPAAAFASPALAGALGGGAVGGNGYPVNAGSGYVYQGPGQGNPGLFPSAYGAYGAGANGGRQQLNQQGGNALGTAPGGAAGAAGATGTPAAGYSFQAVRGTYYPSYPTAPGAINALQQQQQQQQLQGPAQGLQPTSGAGATPTFQPSSFGVTPGAQALLSQALVQAGAAPKDPGTQRTSQQRSDKEEDDVEDVQEERR